LLLKRACAAFTSNAARHARFLKVVKLVTRGRTVAMQPSFAVGVLKKIAHARRDENGQDLLEYGMLAALIALVAFSAVTTVGNTINTVFWQTIAIASNF
jgi:Flp pilus assembly pilin Flp